MVAKAGGACAGVDVRERGPCAAKGLVKKMQLSRLRPACGQHRLAAAGEQ